VAEAEAQRWALPSTVAPLGTHLEWPCRYLAEGEILDRMMLRIADQGVFCYDPPTEICAFRCPWRDIQELDAEGPEHPDQRVTPTRVLALGALSLAAKKRSARTYVTVETRNGMVHFFQVASDVFELRAELSRRQAWLRSNLAVLHTI
jgi:hypothetical protein